MRIALALLLLTACAGRKPDGPPDTEVQIVDELGDPLLGTSSFWARATQDKCVQYGESCTVALPTGDYSLTFRKERAGRPGSQIGGTVQSERAAGCLRARVHVVPGQKIVCKKKGEFNCAKGVYETMDCGNAAAVRYGYKPKPGDEPPSEQ
ncbi:MAG: hypothetical protein E6J88_01640 [Deltaproteobacteria bacterium]|nr:MAG: hypothetical protein E6J88_01640 [Deltaproteobacteria bacterium]